MKLFNLHAKCQVEIERLKRIILEGDEEIEWLEQNIIDLRYELEDQRHSLGEKQEKPKRGIPRKSTSQDSDIQS